MYKHSKPKPLSRSFTVVEACTSQAVPRGSKSQEHIAAGSSAQLQKSLQMQSQHPLSEGNNMASAQKSGARHKQTEKVELWVDRLSPMLYQPGKQARPKALYHCGGASIKSLLRMTQAGKAEATSASGTRSIWLSVGRGCMVLTCCIVRSIRFEPMMQHMQNGLSLQKDLHTASKVSNKAGSLVQMRRQTDQTLERPRSPHRTCPPLHSSEEATANASEVQNQHASNILCPSHGMSGQTSLIAESNACPRICAVLEARDAVYP